jgi:esterase FrsA
MSYTFDISPKSIFKERTPQFVNLGLPLADIADVASRITDTWASGRGGWVGEWSTLAERYSAAGDHFRAFLAYGGAKFPCLATQGRREALACQVREYTFAAPGFPVQFDRTVVPVRVGDASIDVPVHILTPPGTDNTTPVLIASGGIDTWKMDLHPMLVSLALGIGAIVVGFDHPGVGELTDTPLTPESVAVVDQLVAFARTLSAGRIGHFGLSFGGYFSAWSGLRGIVDAAIVLGGPVTQNSFSEENLRSLLFGMEDIFGNAVGFDHKPTTPEVISVASRFPLDSLLGGSDQAEMLVVNGDADIHVPPSDTLVFEGRDRTTTKLISGGSHCALNKLDELMPVLISWGRTALAAKPAAMTS